MKAKPATLSTRIKRKRPIGTDFYLWRICRLIGNISCKEPKVFTTSTVNFAFLAVITRHLVKTKTQGE